MKFTVVRPFRGFTLLETLLALALLLSLMTGIYGIAAGSFDLARSTTDRRLEEMRLTHLNLLVRRLLSELPPEGQLIIDKNGLRLSPVPPALHWKALEDAVAVELGVQGTSLHAVWFGGDGAVLGDVPLLRGVDSLVWEARDAQSGEWGDHWESETRGLPTLLALRLETRSGPAPERLVYQPTPAPSHVAAR